MSRENVEIVRRMWDALGDERLPWLELCDAEYEIRNPPQFPATGPYRGAEGARQWHADVWDVFSEVRSDVEELIEVDDETVVSVQRTLGRMRHTDLKVDVRWAAVWTVRRGKVMRTIGYMSKAEALEAAGPTA